MNVTKQTTGIGTTRRRTDRAWRRAMGMIAVLLSCLALPAATRAKEMIGIVDDHRRPLPGEPPEGWYYNRMGASRGLVNDMASDTSGTVVYWQPDEGVYLAEVDHVPAGRDWTSAGEFQRFGRDVTVGAVYHSVIKPQYQPRILAIEVDVSSASSPSGRGDLSFSLQLKHEAGPDHTIVDSASWTRSDLLEGAFPKTFRLDVRGDALDSPINTIVWELDKAMPSDSIAVGEIRIVYDMPDLDPMDEAAVIWLGQLLRLYNPEAGIVDDRISFEPGAMENVTATGKLSKILSLAAAKGIADWEDSKALVEEMAETLLHVMPRGPGDLMPHFTADAGTVNLAEWASGDTAYALLDLIIALHVFDSETHLQAAIDRLKAIDWASLRVDDGGLCHGYTKEAEELIPSSWRGFGNETLGVFLAAHVGGVTGHQMDGPPTDNGSGFIGEVAYPVAPAGTDRFGNKWWDYRTAAADTQVDWYAADEHPNDTLVEFGLFGLSACERPAGWHVDAGRIYQAYGTGGRHADALFKDGENDVVVGHYHAMIAEIRPDEAIAMHQSLVALRLLSPLNMVESMSVDSDGKSVHVNALLGSWNLGLGTEGWLTADSDIAWVVYQALREIPELAEAWDYYFPTGDQTVQDGSLAAVSGNSIVSIDLVDGEQTELVGDDDSIASPANLVRGADGELWFDAYRTAEQRLYRATVDGDGVVLSRRSSDPYGRSHDRRPIPHPAGAEKNGVLYRSDRHGTHRWQWATNDYIEMGYGTTVGRSADAAAWDVLDSNKRKVYLARYDGLLHYDLATYEALATLAWDVAAPDQRLTARSISLSADGSLMLVSTADEDLYIRDMVTGALTFLRTGEGGVFSPDDGSKIAFVDIPDGEVEREVFIADLASDALTLTDVRRITHDQAGYATPAWLSQVTLIAGDPDYDSDGLSDTEEGTAGSDWWNPDTDGDGLIDGSDPHPLAVHDETPPELTIDPTVVQVEAGTASPDLFEGVSAHDNIDGDISSQVTAQGEVNTAVLGAHLVSYSVFDSAGNQATPGTRTYQVTDTIAPVLLIEDENVIALVGTEPDLLHGVTATDSFEGDLTSQVTTDGLDTDTAGEYEVFYSVSDSSGNSTQTKRTYTVHEDVDEDGLGDAWEREHFGDLRFIGTDDPDVDAMDNASEFSNGSDPNGYIVVLEAGWNLVSFARLPEAADVDLVFGGEDSPVMRPVWAWSAEQQSYVAASGALCALKGYWVYSTAQITVTVEAGSRP